MVRARLVNAAVAFISIVVTLLALEYGYRIYLHFNSKAKAIKQFVVINKPPYRYNADAGFDYMPNSTFTLTFVVDAMPFSYTFVADPDGNPGRHSPQIAAHAFSNRLYVFGDSFTFRHYREDDFGAWPHLLQAKPEFSHAGYLITNFARDGMGVLQMFDFAAHFAKSSAKRPDAIIIAFITDDLTRKRTWRDTVTAGSGAQIPYTSYDPQFRFRTGEYFRTIQVDSDADGHLTRNDTERIQAITDRYNLAAMREDRVGKNLLESHSDIVNNMLYKVFASRIRAQLHHVEFSDFAKDAHFVQAVETIKRSGIPVILVLLPRFEALESGEHIFTEQEQALLDSLLSLTGFPLIDLLHSGPRPKKPEALFLLPYDRHPNSQGLHYYADTLCKALLDPKRHLLPRGIRRAPASSPARGGGRQDPSVQTTAP